MKKSLLITVTSLTVIIVCCRSKNINDNQNKIEKNKICELIVEMQEDDQKYRGMSIMRDPFYEILDSIILNQGISHQEYGNLSKDQQQEYGRRARKIADDRPHTSQKIKDSLMILQKALDNKNTEMLIRIIKANGYPQKDSLPCKKQPDIIFRHSDDKYWEEIKLIINEEYKKGRINDAYYGFILNHIGGRKESDYNKLIKEEKKKNSETIQYSY